MQNDAAFNAGFMVGQAIGYVIVLVGVIAAGAYFSKRLTRKRGDGKKVLWPLGVAVILLLLMILGQVAKLLEHGGPHG